jgi:hypothetical protein
MGNRYDAEGALGIVKGTAARADIPKLAPHDLRRYAECGIIVAPAPGCATLPEENWTRFNFCSDTSTFRRPSSIWVARCPFGKHVKT